MTQLQPVTCERLNASSPAIRHGFFTRRGGVSQGIFASLNTGIGSGDDRAAVDENRTRVLANLGASAPLFAAPRQVHSAIAVVADRPWSPDERPKADAVVTATPGVPLGVLTADCGPVLFADPAARVIGAAHAGWKGATGGILENTVAAMESLGARRENIIATLGPTISAGNYEVGPEFVDRLHTLDSANARFFSASVNAGHAMFDLPGYIVERLRACGVPAGWTGQCTYAQEAEFFSYRRTTHRAEPDYGRQISTIMLGE